MTGIDSLGTLLGKGYAEVTLDEAGAAAVEGLRQAASRFFAGPPDFKQQHAGPATPGPGPGGRAEGGLDGYRGFGSEFSVDDRLGEGAPVQPDQCESYTYWGDDPRRLPRRSELTGALRAYWKAAAGVTAGLLGLLAEHYRYPDELDFAPCSYAGINSYAGQPGPEYLQTTHQDGHLFTLVFAAEPGLEVEAGGAMTPWQGGPGEGIVMAGSLLTAMTGGEVPPAYHRVRNHQRPRLAVTFFANAPFSGYVRPYVDNDSNLRTDLASLSLRNCGLFGKPAPAGPEWRPARSWRP